MKFLMKKIGKISIPNSEKIIGELDRGKTPPKLEFFVGSENKNFKNKLIQLGIDISQQDYTKKLIPIKFKILSDYEECISEYLLKIK